MSVPLAIGMFIAGLALVIYFAEKLVAGVVGTALFGMTVLAFLVSIEELARELPAALKKRPDITYGNVLGSVLAFFLFNGGLIALVRPVQIDAQTQTFYMPACAATVLMTSIVVATRRVPRWIGGVLVAIYIGFVAYGYIR